MDNFCFLIFAFWGIIILFVIIALFLFAPILAVFSGILFFCLAFYCACNKKYPRINKIVLCVLCLAIAVISITCAIFGFIHQNEENAKLCQAPNCESFHLEGSRYCYNHTCHFNGCNNYKNYGDSYCYNHATTPISNISISNTSYEIVTEYFDYYKFHATFENLSGDGFFCYAVLTLYDDTGAEVYKACDQIYEHITNWENVTISIRKSELPDFTSYKWEALREKPFDLD